MVSAGVQIAKEVWERYRVRFHGVVYPVWSDRAIIWGDLVEAGRGLSHRESLEMELAAPTQDDD